MKRNIEDAAAANVSAIATNGDIPPPVKMFKGANSNGGGSNGHGEHMLWSVDSNGSNGTVNASSTVAAAQIHSHAKCRVCLWPRGSPQCYH